MTEARHAELNLVVKVKTADGAASNGKFLTDAARGLANRLTTLVSENPGNWAIEFDVRILEVPE